MKYLLDANVWLQAALGRQFAKDVGRLLTAERHDLKIVSFDSDFDRTPRGRMTVEQVLAEIHA